MNGNYYAQRWGVFLLAVTFLLVLVYDLVAAFYMLPEQSISAIVLRISRAHPILPFIAGLIVGHLFWPQQ